MESGLSFSAADLAQTRFAVSPMWEVVTSFRLLRAPNEPTLHRRWAAQVRPRLAQAGLDRGWLAELVPGHGFLADFLNPTPATPFPALAAELDAIRAAAPAQVRKDLDILRSKEPAAGHRPSPRLRLLREAPEEALEKVVAEIETYWELALAPYWARIRQLLEADVFHRARQVAEHGSARVLSELHETVRWDDGTLHLVRRHCALTRDKAGSGLLLVPSAFAWPRVLTRAVAPDPPQLAYPARGIGNLWAPRTSAATDAVAAVIGRSRTLLLTELDTPASTTRLAAHCGLSAAAVSQHLTALRNAGLVTAHRSGRSVLYARTAVADALLAPSEELV
ncbi:helix-turn-helix domain-containing protein [Streptomyces sp. Je 1-79]|uniref:ArsR/SmtB family transcription factor n=1 Tax=Streptomyces sp. Je 1-79 TaxID=2943847 RepID=UPI0021A46048|nr:helix-turn-helix domain-containing protein [Streptomyces sp. Je 1-79]MCT4357217.1 helix-turn-helix domain-containing protein [Streptomyces sp. Je 1-79]